MTNPTHWTAAGFKTLTELLASAEIAHSAKAVEEAATEVVAARSLLL